MCLLSVVFDELNSDTSLTPPLDQFTRNLTLKVSEMKIAEFANSVDLEIYDVCPLVFEFSI